MLVTGVLSGHGERALSTRDSGPGDRRRVWHRDGPCAQGDRGVHRGGRGMPLARLTSMTIQNNTNAPGAKIVPSATNVLVLAP